MSYVTDAQLLAQFDDSLLENVNGILLTPSGAVTYGDGVFGGAINLASTSLTGDILSGLTTAFTLGFYLKSVNPGMATNPTTGATESLKMPLLSKAQFTYDPSSQVTTAAYNKFTVWEETLDTGNNVMKVSVGGFSSATLTSTPYPVGDFRHFWVVYDGSGPSLSLYTNASLDTTATVSGTVPSTLAISTALFGVNLGVAGSRYNTVKNGGVLDDLVVFNTARTGANDMYRAIRLGADYLADSDLSSEDEVDQGVVFNDTTTIQVTAMYGNRGSAYAGRSDGKIVRGVRTMWESRREFSDAAETRSLSIITRSTTDNLVVSGGAMNITNAIVRV